jgi:ferredoxin
MAYRVNTKLKDELIQYGGLNANKCFNCGNCTAACGLTERAAVFPRRDIRSMQLGLEGRIEESLDPWLCYYCGDCSDTCPREAEPGELMMSMRRWLTARYDWTGISKLLYTNHIAEYVILGVLAVLVLGLFMIPGFGFPLLMGEGKAAGAMDTVMLQYFAPKHVVHYGDLIMAAILSFFLATNVARMWTKTMRGSSAGMGHYLGQLHELIIHAATQKRWTKCDGERARFHWARHLILVTGYGTMLLLVVVFLTWFQVEDTSWHWTSIPGYYATLILLGVTGTMLKDRMDKKDQIHKFSHPSDWLFLVLLFATSLTGIMLHAFRLVDLAMPTYIIYVVHLMVAVPMLLVEVPFGKWSHLAYRPVAIYLHKVKEAAARDAVGATSPATAK